jgi:hypothetical protein
MQTEAAGAVPLRLLLLIALTQLPLADALPTACWGTPDACPERLSVNKGSMSARRH